MTNEKTLLITGQGSRLQTPSTNAIIQHTARYNHKIVSMIRHHEPTPHQSGRWPGTPAPGWGSAKKAPVIKSRANCTELILRFPRRLRSRGPSRVAPLLCRPESFRFPFVGSPGSTPHLLLLRPLPRSRPLLSSSRSRTENDR